MKRTSLKKLLVVAAVAIILLLTVGTSVFASITSSTNTGSITITKLEAGVTAYIYQLTSVNYDYDVDQPYDPQYVWATDLQSWIGTYYSDYISEDGSVSSDFSDVLIDSDSDEVKAFYSKLIAAVKGGDITNYSSEKDITENSGDEKSYPVDENDCTYEITFSGLSMGTYLIIVENGYRVYTPVVANLVPVYDDGTDEWTLSDITAESKSTNPQVEKFLTYSETTTGSYSTTDTIGFTIVADIPTYLADSLSTTYKIKDTLSDGLTLETDSIVIYGVKGSSETKLTEGTHYTFDELEEDGFTVDFDYDEISSYEQIKIEYTTKLRKDSTLVLGEGGIGNSVTLIYSNNPYSDDDDNETVMQEISMEDLATVYTYGIQVKITDSSDSSVVLDNAEFELSSDTEGTLYFILVDGIYYKAESTDSGATTTLVSKNGLITIYGLDEGTYYLQETKAPEDYILDTIPQTIVLVDDDKNGLLDTYDEEKGEYVNTDSAIFLATVENKSGFSLPVTGGYGTVLFVIAGIIVIIIGVVIWKRNAKEEKKNMKC